MNSRGPCQDELRPERSPDTLGPGCVPLHELLKTLCELNHGGLMAAVSCHYYSLSASVTRGLPPSAIVTRCRGGTAENPVPCFASNNTVISEQTPTACFSCMGATEASNHHEAGGGRGRRPVQIIVSFLVIVQKDQGHFSTCVQGFADRDEVQAMMRCNRDAHGHSWSISKVSCQPMQLVSICSLHLRGHGMGLHQIMLPSTRRWRRSARDIDARAAHTACIAEPSAGPCWGHGPTRWNALETH